jgi:hypothetical protein
MGPLRAPFEDPQDPLKCQELKTQYNPLKIENPSGTP